MHYIRLKETLHLKCRLLADPFANRIRAVNEHVACHFIADAKKREKTDQHHRQQRCQKLCPNGSELHDISSHIMIPTQK